MSAPDSTSSGGSAPRPSAAPHEPAGTHPCEQARGDLSRFLTGQLEGAAGRRFRRHVLHCAPCRTMYREAVRAAARSKRRREDERLEAQVKKSREARQVRRRKLIAATNRGAQGWRLKMVLLPAGLILLLTGFPLSMRSPKLEATWTVGGVEAAGLALGPERKATTLTSGQGCSTHGDARASLEGRGARFDLDGDTRLAVLDAGRPFVRLLTGSLEWRGTGRVGAQLGLVELEDEGHVRVRVGIGTMEVECLAGAAEVANAGLRRELVAGESAVLGLGEIAVVAGSRGDSREPAE